MKKSIIEKMHVLVLSTYVQITKKKTEIAKMQRVTFKFPKNKMFKIALTFKFPNILKS